VLEPINEAFNVNGIAEEPAFTTKTSSNLVTGKTSEPIYLARNQHTTAPITNAASVSHQDWLNFHVIMALFIEPEIIVAFTTRSAKGITVSPGFS
jgi:hypothetical protein